MADLQDQDPLVAKVAAARAASSRRPDEKFPTGRLNQIGKHVYAYSGPIPTTDSASSNLLTFVTSSSYIVGTFTPYHGAETTQNMQFTLYFNDTQIAQVSSREAYDFARANAIHILIPPYTKVTVDAIGLESGTNSTSAVIVGEVF